MLITVAQMPITKFTSNSVEQTRSFGRLIGDKLSASTVIALDGTLGAGKTHLTQGIAAGLDVPSGAVVSPTFTICIPYEARLPMLHLDAYRIRSPEEVDQLGLDESVSDGAVLVVEWASRIETLLPPIDLKIHLTQASQDTRELALDPISDAGQQLVQHVSQNWPE